MIIIKIRQKITKKIMQMKNKIFVIHKKDNQTKIDLGSIPLHKNSTCMSEKEIIH